MQALAWSSRHPGALRLISSLCSFHDPRLETHCFGLRFPNPIGLAAGFDKHAKALLAWPALGFGFVEIGSVTAQAQPGNPKPRLFRLPEDNALINRFGFNNDGAEVVTARLRRVKPLAPVPVGINLGKSKTTPLDKAPEDYLHSLQQLWPVADYFVINVSSPNTPNLRELQEKTRLAELLQAIMNEVNARPDTRPVLLKIAPDLSWEQLDEVLELALGHGVAGLIATNTTTSRQGVSHPLRNEVGGLSGEPLKMRSLEVLHHLRAQLGNSLPIISVGGVSSVEDVYERLEAGASLVQLYTALVYQGPRLVRALNQGLARKLEREGMSHVGELPKR